MFYSDNQRNVLIATPSADDHEIISHLIKKAFGQLVKVFNSNTKQQAFDKTKRQQFDMVIADTSLEGFSQREFVFNSRSSSDDHSTGFIFITDDSNIDNSPSKENKKYFLTHPIDYFGLLNILSQHLGLEEVEQYKAAKMISELINSSNDFLQKVNSSKTTTDGPTIKREKESISGNSKVLILGNEKFKSTQFVLSFEKVLLEKLNSIIGQKESFREAIVLKAATKIILNHISSKTKEMFADDTQKIPIHNLRNEVLDELIKKKAVVFKIKTPDGNLYLYAF